MGIHNMSDVYVQFTDDENTTVKAIFGCPQDSVTYPNQSVISDSDPRYMDYYNQLPEMSRKFFKESQAE